MRINIRNEKDYLLFLKMSDKEHELVLVIDCTFSSLENLDVSKNINLEHLYCNNTKIENLDVSKNINLKILYCYNTEIENLDISKNINLEYLDCDNTKIENLDVSKNINLEVLFCDNFGFKWNTIEEFRMKMNNKLFDDFIDSYENKKYISKTMS